MRPPDEERAAAEAAIHAAEHALAGGQVSEARRHLNEAGRLGASHHDIEAIHERIRQVEESRRKSAKGGKFRGFLIGIICYLFLSIQRPTGWSTPVWIALAFVAIPLLVGYFVGRVQGPE